VGAVSRIEQRTFWSRNKWVSRTHHGMIECQVCWSYLRQFLRHHLKKNKPRWTPCACDCGQCDNKCISITLHFTIQRHQYTLNDSQLRNKSGITRVHSVECIPPPRCHCWRVVHALTQPLTVLFQNLINFSPAHKLLIPRILRKSTHNFLNTPVHRQTDKNSDQNIMCVSEVQGEGGIE